MKFNLILFGFITVLILLILPANAINVHSIPPPDETGPFHIGRIKISYYVPSYGRYWATIRYPAVQNGWCAPKDMSQGPYPGIVVSNGWSGSEWNIKWIPEHITSYGYVTICFTPPRKFLGDITQWAYGFTEGIEKLKSLNNRRLSPVYGMVDVEKFGVIGLSMGGGGCIEAAGAPDSEIDAAVPLAPANSNDTMDAARNITIPTQLQVGNNDGMVPPAEVTPFYTDLISNSTVKEYLSITGGNHIGFIDEFYAKLAEFFGIDNPKGIEFSEQRRISRKYFTAWFQYYLKEIDEYYTYIFGEEAQKDLDNGILTDLRYNIP